MEIRTACPFDCPDGCGIIAEVQDGKLISVRGDDTNPRTAGYLCRKMQHYEQMVNNPDRVLYPMRRTGAKGSGEFTRISWDEALEEITSRWNAIIDAYGAEAILPYSFAGTEGLVQFNTGIAFFNYMGASQLDRVICTGGKDAGWGSIMGGSVGMDAERLAESDVILVWSAHLAATRLHDIPYIKKAREAGAKVFLIDVYRNGGAVQATDVRLIRPGTDGALALGMLHIMERDGLTDKDFIRNHILGYEDFLKNLAEYTPEWTAAQTGLTAAEVEELAQAYGAAKRPGIVLGSGFSRRSNGANATRAICALAAAQGCWKDGCGIVGCGNNAGWTDGDKIVRPDLLKGEPRTVNMMQLGGALNGELSGAPVKALYVYSANPANVDNDQNAVVKGLLREDLFTVVHDRFLTDTAKMADIVLPATFSTEHSDVYESYGYNALRYGKKICEAPAECLSNRNTFARLAEKMGYDDPYFKMSESEICEYLLRREDLAREVTDAEWAALMAGSSIVRPLPVTRDSFDTASGKIEFFNEEASPALLAYVPETVLGEIEGREGSLALVMAPSVHTLNSTFNSQPNLVKSRGEMALLIHTADAAARGIADGALITAENAYGSISVYAKVTDGIARGTVVAEGVYTLTQAPGGRTVNALTGQALSDMGEASTLSSYRIYLRA